MNDKLAIDDAIIVTDYVNKNRVIAYLSSLDKMYNTHVMTFQDLLDNYYFTYDSRAIYYLMHKYHLKYDIALIYLRNMYYVDKRSSNSKINKIYKYKKELQKEGLLKSNDYFAKDIASKKIIVYNISYLPNIIKKIIPKYDIVCDDCISTCSTIYELKTIDQEVCFVADQIAELLKQKIDINKIYLTNLNDEYRLLIKRFFKMYHIPVMLNDADSIYATSICHDFLSFYDKDIKVTLDKIKEHLKEGMEIYNKIVSICNKYSWCDNYLDVKDLIIYDLKHTSIPTKKYDNCVREIPFKTPLNDDDYVFLLGFNQGVIPIIYKDEDYFNDREKELLHIETSIAHNEYERLSTLECLKRYHHLVITYKLKTLTDTFKVSDLNEDLGYEITTGVSSYHHSHTLNKLMLAGALDLYNKYGSISDHLVNLSYTYATIPYRSYDNTFKGLPSAKLYQYLDNKLLLSYSSLDNYNRCGFRYYVGNVLKLNIYEETFMQFIGNLFHYVLSQAFQKDFQFDSCFDGYITKELSPKERFFVTKLKQELKFIIDVINEQNTHTMLNEEKYEEKVYVNLEGNIEVTFMGIIDKLKYRKVDDKYVVAIIDYKTGNPNLNLNNVIYGIEMQLPIYIYLAKHHPSFDHIEVAGFYLQKILHNNVVADPKTTFLAQRKQNLLLQGYSNDNPRILSLFDDSYDNSLVVKSLKTSAKGFYSYSKVLSSETIDQLVNLTEAKINDSATKIMQADFTINPKRINNDNVGCTFCPFKDICFMTEKDIVDLKNYTHLEFLGGGDNV